MTHLRKFIHLALVGFFLLSGCATNPVVGQPPTMASVLAASAVAAQYFRVGGQLFGARVGGVNLTSLRHNLKIDFMGASAVQPVSSAAAQTGGKLAELKSVSWTDLWPGIGLTYQADPEGLAESVYQLAPGADAGQIILRYHAAASLGVNGGLQVKLADGMVNETAPLAWQEIGGERKAVGVAFTLRSDGQQETQVGFRLGAYDPAYALTIDPRMIWSTTWGQDRDDDVAWSIAVDPSGYSVVCGRSTVSWGNPIRPHTAWDDAFVAKLDASGGLLWNTFIGGAGNDGCEAIALDTNGAIYIAGGSSQTWGLPLLGYSYPAGAAFSGFVARLTSDGVLQWNGFVGTNFATAIAVRGANLYLAGDIDGQWGGTPVQAPGGSGDGLVLKMVAATGALVWNTYVGGSGFDRTTSMAIDPSGNILVVGMSNASWGNTIKRAFSGVGNSYVVKLNTAGVQQWNAFVGGTGSDDVRRVAVDSVGAIYLTGGSSASWGNPVNPFNAAAHQTDTFIAKFSGSGDLMWNTFQGGAMDDYAMGLAISSSGDVYVAGNSEGGWGAIPILTGNTSTAYIAKLTSADGKLAWVQFFQRVADGSSYAHGLGLDANDDLYVAGEGIMSLGAPVRPFSGSSDALVTKWDHVYDRGRLPRLWGTYLGASDDQHINDMVVDGSGNVYITGDSSSDSGTGSVRPYTAATDAFVAMLDSSGGLAWQTYLGGIRRDHGNGITLDAQGHLLVVGSSEVTWGSPKQPFSGWPDAFLASLDPQSGALNWHTFFGGGSWESASDVTSDAAGNSYVTGYSNDTWGAAPVRPYNAKDDTFVVKFDPAGALLWKTFLGGSENDSGVAIAMGSAGQVVVLGTTPAGWGAVPLSSYQGLQDCMVASLASADGARQWHRFVGGANNDGCNGLTVDASGNIYVSGDSLASWGTPLQSFKGPQDGFVVKLSPAGALTWSTFLGRGNLHGVYVGLNPAGDLYVTASAVMGTVGSDWTDTLIGKVGAGGNLLWHSQFGNNYYTAPAAFAIGKGGNLFVASTTMPATTLVPSGAGSNNFDALVTKIDPTFYAYLPSLMR